MRLQITEGNIDEETATGFITFCTKDELNVELNSKQLMKSLKEGIVTKLVRAGFLTSEVTGKFTDLYYLKFPGKLNENFNHENGLLLGKLIIISIIAF